MQLLWALESKAPSHQVSSMPGVWAWDFFLILKTLETKFTVCMCMYMCVSVYTHIYIYVYVYIHTYLYICVYACVCVYIHKYICKYIYTFSCVGDSLDCVRVTTGSAKHRRKKSGVVNDGSGRGHVGFLKHELIILFHLAPTFNLSPVIS